MEVKEQDYGKKLAAVVCGVPRVVVFKGWRDCAMRVDVLPVNAEYTVVDYDENLDVYNHMSDDGTQWYTTIHVIGYAEDYDVDQIETPDREMISAESKKYQHEFMDAMIEGKVHGDDIHFMMYIVNDPTVMYSLIKQHGDYNTAATWVMDHIFGLGPEGDDQQQKMIEAIEETFSEIFGSPATLSYTDDGDIQITTEPVEDVIMVKVDGREYETMLDGYGAQRFRSGYADTLFLHGLLDLNKIAVLAAEGKMTTQEYQELNMDLGYSVCGFAEVMATHEDNTGHKTVIENPLWDD